jgi:hypothetical protein
MFGASTSRRRRGTQGTQVRVDNRLRCVLLGAGLLAGTVAIGGCTSAPAASPSPTPTPTATTTTNSSSADVADKNRLMTIVDSQVIADGAESRGIDWLTNPLQNSDNGSIAGRYRFEVACAGTGAVVIGIGSGTARSTTPVVCDPGGAKGSVDVVTRVKGLVTTITPTRGGPVAVAYRTIRLAAR